MPPPTIAIDKPEKFIGTATPLEIKITAPEAPTMKPMQVVFEQNGKQTTLFSLDEPGKAQISRKDRHRPHHPRDRQAAHPRSAERAGEDSRHRHWPVMRGLRTLTATASRDVQVRLERPRCR